MKTKNEKTEMAKYIFAMNKREIKLIDELIAKKQKERSEYVKLNEALKAEYPEIELQ